MVSDVRRPRAQRSPRATRGARSAGPRSRPDPSAARGVHRPRVLPTDAQPAKLSQRLAASGASSRAGWLRVAPISLPSPDLTFARHSSTSRAICASLFFPARLDDVVGAGDVVGADALVGRALVGLAA